MHKLNTEIRFRVPVTRNGGPELPEEISGILFKFRIGGRYKYLVVHPSVMHSGGWHVVSDYRSGRALTGTFYYPTSASPEGLLRTARNRAARRIAAVGLDRVLSAFAEATSLNGEIPR